MGTGAQGARIWPHCVQSASLCDAASCLLSKGKASSGEKPCSAPISSHSGGNTKNNITAKVCWGTRA